MASSLEPTLVSPKGHMLYERAARLFRPKVRTTSDVWGASRVYPPTAGVPGPRDVGLTPYVIPFQRAVDSGLHRRVALMCGSQMGKSDALLDIIGRRLDQQPAPILYVGPNLKFLNEQWEPRVNELLDQSSALRAKVARGRRSTKTRKLVGGVPLRLAHGGSSTALKSDPAALALTDEADELMANVRNQGDPVALVDARGDTYADFVHAVTSTPSGGTSEVEPDPETGLEFWAVQETEDLASRIWSIWQEGTRYHWAWPCPGCGEFFIPRLRCLDVPDGVSPAIARQKARLICPRHGCVIENASKADMNARGVYVAPGQRIEPDGTVTGEPPESDTVSFWVSGLCSPFRTWGERAERLVRAQKSSDVDTMRAVINSQFGELYVSQMGEVPEWTEVQKLAASYRSGDVPHGVKFLTAGVDVSGDRLYYVIRGWGRRQESWLIQYGQLMGRTAEPKVWDDLSELLLDDYGGFHIRQAFIDSGFRPGKKTDVPVNRVYEFCRQHARIAMPSKGYDTRQRPYSLSRIDVNVKGGKAKVGIDLALLDSDYMKSFVHLRVRPGEGMASLWHLPEDVSEAYCRMIVSEARVKKPSGGFQWVPRTRVNHFLDCEALAYAAAYRLGIYKLRDTDAPPAPADGARPEQPAPTAPAETPRARRPPARRVHVSSYV